MIIKKRNGINKKARRADIIIKPRRGEMIITDYARQHNQKKY